LDTMCSVRNPETHEWKFSGGEEFPNRGNCKPDGGGKISLKNQGEAKDNCSQDFDRLTKKPSWAMGISGRGTERTSGEMKSTRRGGSDKKGVTITTRSKKRDGSGIVKWGHEVGSHEKPVFTPKKGREKRSMQPGLVGYRF